MRLTSIRYLTLVATLGALAAVPAADAARLNAYGPSAYSTPRVKSSTYYFCSSGTHQALDICIGNSCGACNVANVRAQLGARRYYKYYGGCADDCNSTPSSCNGGAGNYYVVTGSSGFEFRALHLNSNAYSGSKWCDKGCKLGHWGSTGGSTAPHVHNDNRRWGTRLTKWYTMVGTSCGTAADQANLVGKPRMSY